MRRLVAALMLGALPSVASANGAYTHAHISQLAVERLEAGALRDLLVDPAMPPYWEAGSLFPDSGYAVSDDYGELAHWERFLGAYIAWLRARFAGDYTSEDARRHVAFLMGIASHGMADQTYDTTLLARAFEVDGPESSEAPVDQYADYFIVIDEDVVFRVDAWAPYLELPEVIADASGGHVVTPELLMEGMDRMSAVTGFQGNPAVVRGLYWTSWEHYPFLGTHIYNEAARGSLPWLAGLIARYWEVVWQRLHGTDDPNDDLVIMTVPDDGGVNWPVDRSASAAWDRIALFFGYGVVRDELTPLITLRDPGGTSVPFTLQSAYDGQERNLVYVVPAATLAPDTVYTVELAAGVATLDAQTSTTPFTFSFRTRCAEDRLADCPPLDPPLVTGPIPMRPRPSDAGPPDPDAGPRAPTKVSGGGCTTTPTATSGWWLLALAALATFARRRYKPSHKSARSAAARG